MSQDSFGLVTRKDFDAAIRWTHLQSTTVVPVVPPRHDEYPRFLTAAWPYYVGALSTSIGFVLFSALWLAGDDRDLKKKSSKIE